MLKLFHTAYCLVKQNMFIRSFLALVSLQEGNGLPMGRAYRNRTAASLFIESIATFVQKKTVSSVNSVEFFFNRWLNRYVDQRT